VKRVNLAVVGGGRIADLNIKGYLGHPRCSLKAVCDINADTARQRAEQWQAESWCTNYRQLLQNPAIDALEILTPHHLHHAMVLEAARAGKPVSVQKIYFPLEEADEIIAACRLMRLPALIVRGKSVTTSFETVPDQWREVYKKPGC
jgi:predicted dehydrogenase